MKIIGIIESLVNITFCIAVIAYVVENRRK